MTKISEYIIRPINKAIAINSSSNIFWLASYPRSGNTWMRTMLASVLSQINNEKFDYSKIQSKVPAFGRRLIPNHRKKCILKTHRYPSTYHKKVIYIYRSGLDVAISEYKFEVKKHGWNGSFDEFLKHCSWRSHVYAWLIEKNDLQLLPVKFEDMKKDTSGQLQDVIEFLGLDGVTQNHIDNAVKDADINKMRRADDSTRNKESLNYVGRGKVRDLKEISRYDFDDSFINDVKKIMEKCDNKL